MTYSVEDVGSTVIDWLMCTTLVKSKTEARQLVDSGGFYLNDVRITDSKHQISTDDIIGGNKLVFRKGKRNYFMFSFNGIFVT